MRGEGPEEPGACGGRRPAEPEPVSGLAETLRIANAD